MNVSDLDLSNLSQEELESLENQLRDEKKTLRRRQQEQEIREDVTDVLLDQFGSVTDIIDEVVERIVQGAEVVSLAIARDGCQVSERSTATSTGFRSLWSVPSTHNLQSDYTDAYGWVDEEGVLQETIETQAAKDIDILSKRSAIGLSHTKPSEVAEYFEVPVENVVVITRTGKSFGPSEEALDNLDEDEVEEEDWETEEEEVESTGYNIPA